MIEIMITLDYEIFGNGSGNIIKHMIEPTNKLLDICDKFGAKLTIMFEIGEYWAFKMEEEKGKFSNLNYTPSILMENQVKDAIRRGHDVQLHLHPQWIGAYYDDFWHLNFNFWRLSNLPKGLGDKDDILSIYGVLFKGKKDLEYLLKPVNRDYECIAFRAGAWCIQPEQEIIKAMKKVGILADSTVFQGGFSTDGYNYYDFRKAVSNYGYWWTKENDICSMGLKGKNIIEIPIYALQRPFILNFKWTKLQTNIRREYQYNSSNSSKNQLIKLMLNELFKKYSFQWDFCKLSHLDLEKFLIHALKQEKIKKNDSTIPLVMIGHSKELYNTKNFEKFLNKIVIKYLKEQKVKFTNLREVIQLIR